MKKIVYIQPNGVLAIVTPNEGARLVKRVIYQGQDITFTEPVYVDMVDRRWPASTVEVVEWAETEDQFVARIASKDVPVGTPFEIVNEADIPTDRSKRNKWKLRNGKVEEI